METKITLIKITIKATRLIVQSNDGSEELLDFNNQRECLETLQNMKKNIPYSFLITDLASPYFKPWKSKQ